ncbi:E3 ubiquitin-protein ligase znrf2 [Strongylocentrotus purpuratus]|uniref:E3 ubiquitin-protein ligase ZNRF1 n=1 Tax=Strongylocentrotus purpuratus TaxID=7668 RepID=A0A7M7LIP0_STRPU|nr:E3 ubiquitin-protein ligase znrf2 [Strongylocentrotus purpuratus]|eukprot:XP_001198564.2 PREDICTED: E3 ubiquitin-protein ligase ZNRF2 [Strongylocentrotus purpuratus]
MGQKVSSSPRTVYGAGVGGPDSPGGSTASGGYLSIGNSNGHHNGARLYTSASSSTNGQRNRARSLGSTSTHSNGQAMNIPGGSGASRGPDSDPSSSENSAPSSGSGGGSGSGSSTSGASGSGGGGGRSRGRSFPFHAQSLPTHLFAPALLQGIKCPVCSKFVGADNIELHLLACLTKPRIVYNEDVLTLDSGECVICLEDMLQGDTIARLPCLCIYHKSCIDSWFERNRSCPEHPND